MRSASTAADGISLDETRRRELLRERIAERRAGQPRLLKTLDPTATRMLRAAVLLRSSLSGSAAAPSAAVIEMATRGKAPNTWNRYASTLTRWEAYADRVGTPFLPADPSHFANFLAEAASGSSGHTQTKQRACAIAALSALARVPSPAEDALVADVRSGLRRTLRGTRGRARPIFSYELPTAAALPPLPSGRGGGPRRLTPGGAAAPLSVRKRAREQAVRCSAVLGGAALRFDDLREGQIGDAVVLPDLIDLSVFGSKTDTNLTGQPAVLPDPANPRSGAFAFLEGIRLGLTRLHALDPPVLAELSARFRASLPPRQIGRGPSELASWPPDIRAMAAPLYAVGMPVHCLPIYGQWQHARLNAQSDLRVGVERHIFLALATHALTAMGVDVTGLGAHSWRRGRAVELFHGHVSREVVTEILRHRSAASTRPYITDSARMASLAVTMAAATSGRSAVDRRHHGGAVLAPGARDPRAAPLRRDPDHPLPADGVASAAGGPRAGPVLHPHAPHLAQLLARSGGGPLLPGGLAAPRRV